MGSGLDERPRVNEALDPQKPSRRCFLPQLTDILAEWMVHGLDHHPAFGVWIQVPISGAGLLGAAFNPWNFKGEKSSAGQGGDVKIHSFASALAIASSV